MVFATVESHIILTVTFADKHIDNHLFEVARARSVWCIAGHDIVLPTILVVLIFTVFEIITGITSLSYILKYSIIVAIFFFGEDVSVFGVICTTRNRFCADDLGVAPSVERIIVVGLGTVILS